MPCGGSVTPHCASRQLPLHRSRPSVTLLREAWDPPAVPLWSQLGFFPRPRRGQCQGRSFHCPRGGGGLCPGHCHPCVCVSVSLSRGGEPRPLMCVNTAVVPWDWQTFSGQKCSKYRCLRGSHCVSAWAWQVPPLSSVGAFTVSRVYRLVPTRPLTGLRDGHLPPRRRTPMLNSHDATSDLPRTSAAPGRRSPAPGPPETAVTGKHTAASRLRRAT